MKHRRRERRRCTECREWFYPAASAVGTQRVCCEDCRKKRNRALARDRRRRNLIQYRVDERERQRQCRRNHEEPTATGGPSVTVPDTPAATCHAQAVEAGERAVTGTGGPRVTSRATAPAATCHAQAVEAGERAVPGTGGPRVTSRATAPAATCHAQASSAILLELMGKVRGIWDTIEDLLGDPGADLSRAGLAHRSGRIATGSVRSGGTKPVWEGPRHAPP